MSKKETKEIIKNRKVEILFLPLMLLLILSFRSLFPVNGKFLTYFLLIFLICYLFMIFLLIRSDIRRKNIIKQWLNQEDYGSLPKSFKADSLLEKIRDQDMLIKNYEKEISATNSDLKDYITRRTHQIKSPIFALNLLLEDEDIDREASKVELFEIEEYVQNILGFIRMDSDTTDYAFSQVDLDKEIKSSIKKYARLFIYKNNNVSFKESGLKILSDSKWFGFILDQILSNANKYTKNGRIDIYMEGKNLVIEDEGIGIKEEDLPRIFDKGYTGFNGRLDKKATGIGLSLVKNICQALRIDVRAESKINLGTKIILDLGKIIEEN